MSVFVFRDKAALANLCKECHISRLSLFGSTLRGNCGPESDVDLLVEFEPGYEPGLLSLAGIERKLSSLLDNRKVDLRTAQDLSPYFRENVVSSAQEQYAA